MMASLLELECVETHAEGEPGRVITNAAHLVKGDTMVERFDYCVANLDPLRKAILREPRGYPALCAVFLLPPVNPGSHFGVVVIEQDGFTAMSGSNTICTVTAALESGIAPITGPETELQIDTAVGTIHAVGHCEDGKVRSVTIKNVPAFAHELDFPLEVHGFGEIRADIMFGGQFFAQVKASDLGIDLDPDNGKELARAGALIRLAACEQVPVVHPLYPAINKINLVMIHSGDPVAGEVSRNVVVTNPGRLDPTDPNTWTGALDRSPCGTGTSARMAALYARGMLKLNEPFVHRSIIGSEFTGRLIGETSIAGKPAVLPTITGRGWVTGRTKWTVDPTDIFPEGFTVGDIWGPQRG